MRPPGFQRPPERLNLVAPPSDLERLLTMRSPAGDTLTKRPRGYVGRHRKDKGL